MAFRFGPIPFLENLPLASFAYSLRRINARRYSGPAIRVRRDSDNAEQDIYFTWDGWLDTTQLTSFVGSASGFLSVWYDQSGNGRHAQTATASYQPRIVISGVLQTLLSKPTIYFSGNPVGLDITNATYNLGNTNTIFFIHNNIAGGAMFGASVYRYYRFDTGTLVVMGSGGRSLITSVSIGDACLVTSTQEAGGIVTAYKNGVNVTTTTGIRAESGVIAQLGYNLQGGNRQEFYNGYMSEVILIPDTVVDQGIRGRCETLIKLRYGIQ